MKYLDIVFITIIFFGSVIVSGLSVDSTNSKKGLYYADVESTDNVIVHTIEGMNINYSAELSQSGDSYVLSFDIVNDSGVDVEVEDIICHESDSYIEYQLKYSDGKSIQKGDVLRKGESVPITYQVIYKQIIDIDNYQFDSSFGLRYEQML